MKLVVKTSPTASVDLEVESLDTTTVEEIKNKIKLGLKNQEQDYSLYYKDQLLQDNLTLSHYDIQQEQELYYFVDKKISISISNHSNTSSSSSSNSNQQVVQSINLQVYLSNTIEDIKHKIQDYMAAGTNVNLSYQLLYNGTNLKQDNKEQDDSLLFQLGITDDILIHLFKPEQQPPQQQEKKDLVVLINNKKKNKKRCNFHSCSDKVVKIIGDCGYCQYKYCSRHRLPEAHACINLMGCKQVAHERNSIKLLSERCVASKI
jgi:ubiquitin C